MGKNRVFAVVVLAGFIGSAFGGMYDIWPDVSDGRVKSPLRVEFRKVGSLRPRAAHEIRGSNWCLGCETLDRGFADFNEYRDLVEPLGIRQVRLQGGWAKCERAKGVYDFAWLDEIVDYLSARGVSCAIETGYGNPIYPGGGGWDLAGGFPTSEVALSAWDAWVDALTRHFATRVKTWLMWNEPDIGEPRKTPEAIAAFNVRTAKIVKRNVPDAEIAGLSLAYGKASALDDCLKAMGTDVGLFDWIVYHGYENAPEASYAEVERMKAVLAQYAPRARLWQGENGCPSEMATRFALSKVAWSEYSQAKWDMRRMLGDLGHDVRSSVFTICDFNHTGREINLKGLLRADEERKVIAVKRAYYAVQNVAGVFDDRWTRRTDSSFGTKDESLSAFHYQDRKGTSLFVFWTHGRDFVNSGEKGGVLGEGEWTLPYERPGDSFETRPAVFGYVGAPLKDPVWVDLLTGDVYAYPKDRQIVSAGRVRLLDVPVYDSPCLLTERSALELVGERKPYDIGSDVLKMPDGTRISSVREWEERAKPLIFDFFEKNVYGPLPPKPTKLDFSLVERSDDALGGTAKRRQYRVVATDANGSHAFDVLVYLPRVAQGAVPAFVCPNFSGNHTLSDDPAVRVPSCRVYRGETPSEAGRGTRPERIPVADIVARGFALATFCHSDVYVDYEGPRATGGESVWSIFPEDRRGPALALTAWAWGNMRTLDLLETLPEVDVTRAAVVGQSRLAKVAVITAAYDTRFRLCCANDGGCKTLALLPNLRFPAWFSPELTNWTAIARTGLSAAETARLAGRRRPPFDQYSLIGCIAPRALYLGASSQDIYAPPDLHFAAVRKSEPVWRLYGATRFPGDDRMLAPRPFFGDISWHCKPGPHSITRVDWRHYLDRAERLFFGGLGLVPLVAAQP